MNLQLRFRADTSEKGYCGGDLLRPMPRIIHGPPMRLKPLSSVSLRAELNSSAVGSIDSMGFGFD